MKLTEPMLHAFAGAIGNIEIIIGHIALGIKAQALDDDDALKALAIELQIYKDRLLKLSTEEEVP